MLFAILPLALTIHNIVVQLIGIVVNITCLVSIRITCVLSILILLAPQTYTLFDRISGELVLTRVALAGTGGIHHDVRVHPGGVGMLLLLCIHVGRGVQPPLGHVLRDVLEVVAHVAGLVLPLGFLDVLDDRALGDGESVVKTVDLVEDSENTID